MKFTDYEVVSASAEITELPEYVKILPLGNVTSQKGDFIVDDESFNKIYKAFKNRGLDIVVDYEHQTLKDIQAPAGGWIKDIILQADAIAAKVEWTDKAKEYLKNKEYKYLSPVVLVNKATKKAAVLHSVALTNTPAIDNMYPIINSLMPEDLFEGGNKEMEILKEFAILLGLSESATADEIKAAVKELQKAKAEGENNLVANKTLLGLLELNDGATTSDASAKIMELKNHTGFVSEAEFNQLKDKLDKQDADKLVELALKDGKISTAQKEWAEAYALKDPTGFKDFIDKAPASVPVGKIDFNGTKSTNTDDATMMVCKALGMTQDDLDKFADKEDE